MGAGCKEAGEVLSTGAPADSPGTFQAAKLLCIFSGRLTILRTGERVLFKALDAVAENGGWVSSTHMVGHNHL